MAVFSLPCQNNEAIGECISQIYTVSLSLVGIVAFVQIVWGGFMLLTAAGNTSKTGQAMDKIKNAILGIILLFSSYLILNTINPDLVNFKFNLEKITKKENLDNPNKNTPSNIRDFSVSPTLAALSTDKELKFNAKVFSSAQRIASVCGAGAEELVARVDLITVNNQRLVINFSNFSKANFGTGDKAIPWSFNKETQTVVNILTSAGDVSDNKLAKFEFILACPGSNNFIYRSTVVTVVIASQR